MNNSKVEITKEKFEAYFDVQMSGAYNMIMDAYQARIAAGLTQDEYWEIIRHYDEYRDMYMQDEE